MKNYCMATFDIEGWKEEGYKIPECWAFFSISNDPAEVRHMAHLLDIEPRHWLMRDHWAVAFDIVRFGAHDFRHEVRAKRWELIQLGIEWEWCKDLIPGAPAAASEESFMNTYASEAEFEIALEDPTALPRGPMPQGKFTPNTESARPVELNITSRRRIR